MLHFSRTQLHRRISTEIIKRDIQKGLLKQRKNAALEYPRTFQQKLILLNDPRTIQKLQIIQFGVKYKPGKKYLTLILLLSGLFFYYNQQYLPVKVIDCYFAISNSTGWEYPSGFLLAPFMYEIPFVAYLPLLAVVNQMSKFISNRWVFGLVGVNAIINSIVGKTLVDERVQEYQVWDQERISYGQGTLIALSNLLWGALGPLNGFTALKSRVMLKSIPGLGITRAGIPIGYICLFYLLLQGYLWHKGKKNSELIGISAFTGFMFGCLVRRFSPLK